MYDSHFKFKHAAAPRLWWSVGVKQTLYTKSHSFACVTTNPPNLGSAWHASQYSCHLNMLWAICHWRCVHHCISVPQWLGMVPTEASVLYWISTMPLPWLVHLRDFSFASVAGCPSITPIWLLSDQIQLYILLWLFPGLQNQKILAHFPTFFHALPWLVPLNLTGVKVN